MTEFNKSKWANAEFTQEYRDNADVYIVERRRLLEIMKSFYSYFLGNKGYNTVLDLGCGDGIITQELLTVDKSLSATLFDGSADMLNKARERLKEVKNIQYIHASFQELLEKDILDSKFNFIVSSMAIHHLTMEEKRALFRKIYSYLKEGGYFVNIDVVLAPTDPLDAWYMELWQEWMDEKKALLDIEGEPSADIIKRYKDLEENKPDTLNAQLDAMKEIGFKDVDCFYKYGIFTIFGGRKWG